MSIERKLLQEALEWMEELKYVWSNSRDSGDYDLLDLISGINKIEQLLAQPETKQDPAKDYTTNLIELHVSENMTVEQCLDHVKRKNLKQVLVVGIDENDKLVTRSSKMTFSEAVYFLELAKYGLLGVGDE